MDPLQQAHAFAQSGDFDSAARMARAILAREPRHAYALFLLGSIEAQQGKLDEAAKHLGDAVRANPRSPDALTSYGRVLLDLNRPREAIDALNRALQLQPQNPFALIARGQSFVQSGNPDEALRDFERAVTLDPRSTIARAGLIALLVEKKNFTAALPEVEQALRFDPKNPEFWHSHGFVLMQINRRDEALASFAKATALDPQFMSAYLHSANVLMDTARLDDALSWCGKAIASNPNYAPAHLLRGNILLHLGKPTEALTSYDAAVAASPDYAEAHYHRGSALLLQGRFKEGFADFEYRWQAADCGFDRPKIDAPEWRGEPLAGKSIVVYSEQGMGDTIQFARFLPMLARMGAKLTFLCHPNLIRLFKSYATGMEIIATTDAKRRFDFQCALMSLPHWLGTELATVPNPARYLTPEEDRVAYWREKIGASGFRIGIGWQGNPHGLIDRGRSMPLASFVPLSSMPGVRLISLQKIHGLEQLANLPRGMTVETLGDFDKGEDAFVDTAAILQSLDLVVTSDTALPHLAGALGVPTWVALKHVPDWRWMLDRNDSPWYPSLRLFRQSVSGAWQSVFSRMAGEVRRLAEPRTNP